MCNPKNFNVSLLHHEIDPRYWNNPRYKESNTFLDNEKLESFYKFNFVSETKCVNLPNITIKELSVRSIHQFKQQNIVVGKFFDQNKEEYKISYLYTADFEHKDLFSQKTIECSIHYENLQK